MATEYDSHPGANRRLVRGHERTTVSRQLGPVPELGTGPRLGLAGSLVAAAGRGAASQAGLYASAFLRSPMADLVVLFLNDHLTRQNL